MSKENVQKFYELLKADKVLAGELQNAVHAVVLQFAAKKGLAFTAEEQAEFDTQTRALSDEELEQLNAAGTGAGNETVSGTSTGLHRGSKWCKKLPWW